MARNKERNQETHFCSFLPRNPPNNHTVNVYFCWLVVQRDRVTVMLSVLLYSMLSVQRVYNVQLNCADSNYSETEWVLCWVYYCTAHLLYKLYSVQLNCTYSNYTQAAATCSAAQQHSTFTVQILYKLYSLLQNCTYSNYSEVAAKCSAEQQERNFQADVFWSRVQSAVWNRSFI